MEPGSVAARVVQSLPLDAAAANTIPWRRAELPGSGGFGNARSVAMIHAPMACGGEANGVRLLSPSGADPVFDEQTYAQDLVLPLKLRHGIGFGLPSPDRPISPNPRACYWGGWGGSLAVIDLDARMTFAYVMNKMGEGTTGDLRAASILAARTAAVRPGPSARPARRSSPSTMFSNAISSSIDPSSPTWSTRLWCPSVTRNPPP